MSKTKIQLIAIALLVCFTPIYVMAQMTQNIRGTLMDEDSKSPLIGANVILLDHTPIKGSITDVNGNFKIEDVPVGRVSLKISSMGYEERIIPNLLVSSAKELILNLDMKESFEKLEEVIIQAKKDKSEVLNEMSLVSSRSFSVDETKRFAGSFADPARMASAFAGVTNSPEGNNDIIVRGNSPRGILWRLEGIEIPNPNHFASDGATGGPINALSSNMLSDSDFMSGAFAPEYGNALSGVFDMKLKRGNNEQKEYTAGISTLGIDFAAEGPFKSQYDGSYLINYRYSSLDLIDKLGVIDFGGVPKYQDLSFNVHLPVNKKHSFSIFGLGGISAIHVEDKWEDEEEIIGKSVFENMMGTVGITHTYLINNKSYFKSYLSLSGTNLHFKNDLPVEEGASQFYNSDNADYLKTTLRVSTTYGLKINAKQKLEIGFILNRLGYNMTLNSWDNGLDAIQNILDEDGETLRTQGFATWKIRASEKMTITSGFHLQHIGLNNSFNLEPRIAAKWDFIPGKSLSFGFGSHSKMESAAVYAWKVYEEDNTYTQPNQSLEVTKALHYVIAYDQSIGRHTHLKAELYYQYLYDVPVQNDPNSTKSYLNVSDEYSRDELINSGTGRNYGIELTLEQYLHQGFYYLGSASLFNSLYTPMDGIERKTTYSNDYIMNLLIGKEFSIGKPEKDRVLMINGKISLLGGKRFTPVDLEASIEAGEEVRNELDPFSQKSDDIFIANLAIGIRRNKNKTTREFKIDVQNATNNQAVVGEYFVAAKNDIFESVQLPLFPTISYSISF